MQVKEKNSKLPKWAIIVIAIAFLLNLLFVILPAFLILFGIYMIWNMDIFMDKKEGFEIFLFCVIYI